MPSDTDLIYERALKILPRDERSVALATRDQIFRYFALCMRAEKFGDGSIAEEFDKGRILAALRRLREA